MSRTIVCILISCFMLAGCSNSTSGDNRVVAQINNYKMTVDDLRYELENVPYDEAEGLRTEQGKKYFIDRLVEKETLLQEAQRQGLDRNRDFMKSIEGYWEQALLRLLLERKSKEISGSIHVYDNEVEEYYRDSGEKLPISRVRDDIRRAIRQEKETEAMNAWIEELKSGSSIKIDKALLKEIFPD